MKAPSINNYTQPRFDILKNLRPKISIALDVKTNIVYYEPKYNKCKDQECTLCVWVLVKLYTMLIQFLTHGSRYCWYFNQPLYIDTTLV